jgi:hypothetical protein
MGLKDTLIKHNVPLPPDFDERMEVMVATLKRSPGYKEKIAAFKRKTRGGAAPSPSPAPTVDREDWLGPNMNRFIDVVTSPGARALLQAIFAVVFILKYLESLPVFGRILSAALDLQIMGGKMLIKTIQKALPPLFGLLPLPYTALLGMVASGIFGMLVWPIVALVSLSRADFTAALDSILRVIPPPFGDSVADIFLEGNRAIARIDEKRVKLTQDIVQAFTMLSDLLKDTSSNLSEGFSKLAESTKEAAQQAASSAVANAPAVPAIPIKVVQEPAAAPAPAAIPTPVAAPSQSTVGGKRLSRRARKNKKWRTLRTRRTLSRFGTR